METNSFWGNLSAITDSVLFCGTAIDVTTTTTHYITYQCMPTHQYTPTRTNTHSTDTTPPSTFFFSAQIQAHYIPNDTRLAQESIDDSFLHDANMFA